MGEAGGKAAGGYCCTGANSLSPLRRKGCFGHRKHSHRELQGKCGMEHRHGEAEKKQAGEKRERSRWPCSGNRKQEPWVAGCGKRAPVPGASVCAGERPAGAPGGRGATRRHGLVCRVFLSVSPGDSHAEVTGVNCIFTFRSPSPPRPPPPPTPTDVSRCSCSADFSLRLAAVSCLKPSHLLH